ncbi:Re/Si-specific NAD(P)(+) transhydrogenase subunit alpha [Marinicella sp. S1101]|uniref:Re/Si-specific NAD(P)(+) transhydrogenase subunit alpha n=1 Tax=Marinicella marina TaxID=2996016 RepID=UPI002260CC01|nr:Re/Si-specific NAD(P)(+) transhydrogenase subunit alpha [Marinicella marina]MCX7552839.1 Re/Si-specific NAD(P)(+) transhydrogenase subunit alpha [Marinicella marina]MDJ1139852.1 Re/Si-specific NAD(P)(+) transhydrogenase subunit alpha [Marinicella marina]
MTITIGFLKERNDDEKRVALVPETAEKILKLGWQILFEPDAGESAGFPNEAYPEMCQMAKKRSDVLNAADILVGVDALSNEDMEDLKNNSVVVGMVSPYQDQARFTQAAEKDVTVFSMELIPRTTRAQAMDVLSSQASVAGYKAVLLAASEAPRFFPMLTTAAGTIRPASVLVIGAGVAGLQAMATARRLGANVTGYDVRPETVEQVKSLGAKFLDLGVEAVGEGGYARALTDEEKQTQQQNLAKHLTSVDVLITTAAVPGRPAPRIITAQMVNDMKPGSVIVDLGAEGGGNCEPTEAGVTKVVNNVKVIGPKNLSATVPLHASEMYSRNVWNLLSLMHAEGEFKLDWEDDILAGCVVTKGGEVVHPAVVGEKGGEQS